MTILRQVTNQNVEVVKIAELMYTSAGISSERLSAHVIQKTDHLNLKKKMSYGTNDRLVSDWNTHNLSLLQKVFDDCLQTIASAKFRKVTRFYLFRSGMQILISRDYK